MDVKQIDAVAEPLAVIRAAHVSSLLGVLKLRPADRAQLLLRFDLPSGLDATPDAYVALGPVRALFRWAELNIGGDLTARALAGLSAARLSAATRQELQQLPSLACALERLSRFAGRELSGVRFVLHRGDDQVIVRCRQNAGNPTAFESLLLIMLAVAVVRHYVGESWRPEGVSAERAGLSAQSLARCDLKLLRHRRDTGVVFSASLLKVTTRKFFGHAPALKAEAVSTELTPADPEWDFPSSLRSVLKPYFTDGCPDLELAGRITGVCGRTLQRHLKPFGLRFAELQRDVRLSIATSLLRDERKNVTEAAAAAGYSDASHFTRAFRQSIGVTPKQFLRSAVPA
jgi:AraC-like DNA-binding protein